LPQLPARKYPELLRSCRVGPGGPACQFSENSAAQLKEGSRMNCCRIYGIFKKGGFYCFNFLHICGTHSIFLYHAEGNIQKRKAEFHNTLDTQPYLAENVARS
jgi:hypothetical protein